MKRRFVSAILASVTAAMVLVSSGSAKAQEFQVTGPLKGAPAVRRLRLYRGGRLEIAPAISFTLLDEYRRTILAGAQLHYNITDWFAFGAWGAGGVVSSTTDLTDQIEQKSPRDALTATNINHSQVNGNYSAQPFADQTAKINYVIAPQITFTPFRGKLAIFNKIFVDTDLYIGVGAGFVGIQERGNCGGGSGQVQCSDPASFKLASSLKVAPTAAIGLTFYPAGFWSFGVEYRALPFAWNRAGFDQAGTGPGGNFPDGKVDSHDETYRFNQLVTVSLGFYLPTEPRLSR